MNAADIARTASLPTANAMVTAGAKEIIVGFPDEGIFQRWDLETLTRQGASVASPIKARLKALADGNDLDGPVRWQPGRPTRVPARRNPLGSASSMPRLSKY